MNLAINLILTIGIVALAYCWKATFTWLVAAVVAFVFGVYWFNSFDSTIGLIQAVMIFTIGIHCLYKVIESLWLSRGD